MSHLKALKLASAVPVRATADPVQRSREKIVEALYEQKALVNAKMTGTEYVVFHDVTRKNEAGERVKVKAPKRMREGWFTNAAGKVFFALRYAGKPIDFAKDKNAIEVGELAALPAVLDTLVDAVRAGELDTQLVAAAAERGQMLRRAE
jgi:hypothetical protein